MHRFAQVDVFTDTPYQGNALAVVLDADGLDTETMQRIANWTNLSETAFVLQPSTADADYRVRIFTPARELPFAGHPTIGSCHAWLTAGGVPRGDGIVQECGVGLVRIRHGDGRLAFAAPPLRRSEPLATHDLDLICKAIGVSPDAVSDHRLIDNGPAFATLLLTDAATVLATQPDLEMMGSLMVGIAGMYGQRGDDDPLLEVRMFAPSAGVREDPVTGAFNAALAQWLIAAGHAPSRYVASQGTVLGRAGRVHIEASGDEVWVGGDAVICIEGQLRT